MEVNVEGGKGDVLPSKTEGGVGGRMGGGLPSQTEGNVEEGTDGGQPFVEKTSLVLVTSLCKLNIVCGRVWRDS